MKAREHMEFWNISKKARVSVAFLFDMGALLTLCSTLCYFPSAEDKRWREKADRVCLSKHTLRREWPPALAFSFLLLTPFRIDEVDVDVGL